MPRRSESCDRESRSLPSRVRVRVPAVLTISSSRYRDSGDANPQQLPETGDTPHLDQNLWQHLDQHLDQNLPQVRLEVLEEPEPP